MPLEVSGDVINHLVSASDLYIYVFTGRNEKEVPPDQTIIRKMVNKLLKHPAELSAWCMTRIESHGVLTRDTQLNSWEIYLWE